MDERVIRFRVGVVVLATFLVAAILIVLFGERTWVFQPTYTLYVHFSTAPGVTKDTPVRKDGLLIGRVVDVRFSAQDDRFEKQRGVNVTLAINKGVVLVRGEVCRITYANVFGDSILEFVPGVDDSNVLLASGDYIEGRVPVDPFRFLTDVSTDLTDAIRSVSRAGNEFGNLSHRLNETFGDDDQLTRIINKTEKALDTFQLTMGNADKLLGDEELQTNLKAAFNELPTTLTDARDAIRGINKMATSADANLRNLQNFTKPLGDNGGAIVNKIDSSIGQLDELLSQLVEFTKKINTSDGSLGLLLNDRELYDNLNATAATAKELARKLRPIINDVRIVTDDLAREGPRGLIQKKGPAKY